MVKLNNRKLKMLRKMAHPLKPVAQIGKQGLTEAVLDSLYKACNRQELIKVSVLNNCEATAEELAVELRANSPMAPVQVIGHTIVLYMPAEDQKNQKITKQLKEG